MHRLTLRIRDERGIVMVLAMLVLFTVALLSVVVITSAVTANEQSNVQTNRRIALQDANSGLQAAVYRLGAQPFQAGQSYAIAPTHCFDTKEREAPPASGEFAGFCTPFKQSGSLGSLGSYSYDVSQALSNGSGPGCTGFWVNENGFTGITQRCITATGTYKGVTRRVQERVAAENFAFPVNGILSLGIIEWDTSGSQHLNLPGTYQANGYIMVGKGAQETPDNLEGATLESFKEIKLGPGQSCPASCKMVAPTASRFAPTVGPSAETYKYASEHNNDAALTTGVWAPGGKPAYKAATKELVASKIGTPSSAKSEVQPKPVVMPAGTYFFCEMKVETSAIETAGQVTIYIGSPGVGGCPGTVKVTKKGSCNELNEAGTIVMKGADFTNPSNVPAALQFFVWGNGPEPVECELPKNSQGQIEIENPGNPKNEKKEILPTASEIYAPDSFLTTKGEGIWWKGGLVVGGVESNDNDVWQFTGTPPGQEFFPTAWTVCPPTPSSAADAGSGCY